MTLDSHLWAVLLQVETAAISTAPTVYALRQSAAARLAVTAAAQIHMELHNIAARGAAASTALVPAVECCPWSPPAVVVEHASSSQASGEGLSTMSQATAASPKQVSISCMTQ